MFTKDDIERAARGRADWNARAARQEWYDNPAWNADRIKWEAERPEREAAVAAKAARESAARARKNARRRAARARKQPPTMWGT